MQITQATECLLPTLTPLLPAYSFSTPIQRGNETGFEQDRTPEILENKNLIIILLDFIKLLKMKINKNQIKPNQRGRNQKYETGVLCLNCPMNYLIKTAKTLQIKLLNGAHLS
ncbi:hypothetical protein H6F74_17820 [Trichocoleus sp. FACHB-90]|uniref:hypothetical protein n=1 Tax=Cyanophyceae TaxID=3028117 RepID=UPI001682610F|nr:hypothetical protein [Trichocoleus sp. FACHB-90]MBD1928089.1 hypothetical protein [Trichocoleus sp. FACHB-90]